MQKIENKSIGKSDTSPLGDGRKKEILLYLIT
jgi:hypothetical protein